MTIKESKNKIKVGDWVKTNGSGAYGIYPQFLEGYVGEVSESCFYIWQDEKEGDASIKNPTDWGFKYSWRISFFNCSATIEILNEAPKFIVHCPTEDLWKKALDRAFRKGLKWCDGDQEYSLGCWSFWKKNSALKIDNEIAFSFSNYYKERFQYKDYIFLTAEQWLNLDKLEGREIDITTDEFLERGLKEDSMTVAISNPPIFNPPKYKFMSIIKNLFKSKDHRALEHFGLVNGDGGLTEAGQKEFIDFCWEKMEAERKEFIGKIVEAFDKEVINC